MQLIQSAILPLYSALLYRALFLSSFKMGTRWTTDIQIDLVVSISLSDGSTLSKFIRVRASQLQRYWVLLFEEFQVTILVSVYESTSCHHLCVQPSKQLNCVSICIFEPVKQVN